MLTGRTAFVTVDTRGVRTRARKVWLPGVGTEFAEAAASAASDSGAAIPPPRRLHPVPAIPHARAV
jgi:hypothetical protein